MDKKWVPIKNKLECLAVSNFFIIEVFINEITWQILWPMGPLFLLSASLFTPLTCSTLTILIDTLNQLPIVIHDG